MKFQLLSLVAACVSSASFAATFTVEAPVTSALFYTQSADVTRTADLDLPQGEHTVLIEKTLADDNDAQITVNGATLIAQSIVAVDTQPQMQAITDLELKIAQIEQQMETQKQLISAIALHLQNQPDALVATSAKLIPLEKNLTQLLDEKNGLQQELKIANNALNNSKDTHTRKLTLNVAKAGKVNIKIRSNTKEANWLPKSVIALDTRKKIVTVTGQADITQNTGLDWGNAKISFAITPQQDAQLPMLITRTVQEIDIEPVMRAAPAMLGVEMRTKTSEDLPIAMSRGIDFEMQLPQTISIASGESDTLTYFTQSQNAEVSSNIYAWVGDYAILVAKWEQGDGISILPGQMQITRDNTLIATRTDNNLWQPKTARELSFGIDPQVSVETQDSPDFTDSQGIISKQHVDKVRKHYVISTRADKSLKFFAQVPISGQKGLTVIPLNSMHPDKTEVDGVKGIYQWTKNMNKDSVWNIDFGYDITYPENKKIFY